MISHVPDHYQCPGTVIVGMIWGFSLCHIHRVLMKLSQNSLDIVQRVCDQWGMLWLVGKGNTVLWILLDEVISNPLLDSSLSSQTSRILSFRTHLTWNKGTRSYKFYCWNFCYCFGQCISTLISLNVVVRRDVTKKKIMD